MAKLKISQMPSESIYSDSIFPMVHDGINYKVTFDEIKQAVLAGFNPGTGIGVEYVSTPFTDFTNATRVEYSTAYDALLDVNHQPFSGAGQVAEIVNGGNTPVHYELQQNLLIDNTIDRDVFDLLQNAFKRLEVIYEIGTVLFTTSAGDITILKNFFIDSFQRTSEAVELQKQHTIDHQINFILGPGEVARITNQTIIKSVQYDFQDAQVSNRIGIIRVVEASHDSYLNTKIFS
jgi:hypothetical protein